MLVALEAPRDEGVWDSGDKASLILNLDTKLRLVFTSRSYLFGLQVKDRLVAFRPEIWRCEGEGGGAFAIDAASPGGRVEGAADLSAK